MPYLLGAHVSIAGGLHKAFERATHAGYQTFQIFTRNPRGWKSKPVTNDVASKFLEFKAQYQFHDIVAHMPYLPNLSAPDNEIYMKSIDSLLNEIQRCDLLGIPYLVTHLGHHKRQKEKGWKNLLQALIKAQEFLPQNVTLALENTAGEKNSIGSDFHEIAEIFSTIETISGSINGLSLCFDTCHAFAAGYDLSNETSIHEVFDLLKDLDLYEKTRVIHLNDAKMPLGSGKDRHANIGTGFIGINGFKALLKTEFVKDKPLVLETPNTKEHGHKKDFKIIQSLLPREHNK